jgi:hypothetical protein
MFGLKPLVEALPGGIHINRLPGLAMATAALGFYHDAVGLKRIFVMVNDVLYLLLAVCIRVVKHFQQLADVFF